MGLIFIGEMKKKKTIFALLHKISHPDFYLQSLAETIFLAKYSDFLFFQKLNFYFKKIKF